MHDEHERIARTTLLEIIARTPQGVLLLDLQGKTSFANGVFRTLTDYDEAALLGLHATDLFTTPEGSLLPELLCGHSHNLHAQLHAACGEVLAVKLSVFTATFDQNEVRVLLI